MASDRWGEKTKTRRWLSTWEATTNKKQAKGQSTFSEVPPEEGLDHEEVSLFSVLKNKTAFFKSSRKPNAQKIICRIVLVPAACCLRR